MLDKLSVELDTRT